MYNRLTLRGSDEKKKLTIIFKWPHHLNSIDLSNECIRTWVENAVSDECYAASLESFHSRILSEIEKFESEKDEISNDMGSLQPVESKSPLVSELS